MGHRWAIVFVLLLAVASAAQGCAGGAAIPRASTPPTDDPGAAETSMNPSPTPPGPSAAPAATPSAVSPTAIDSPGSLAPATRAPGSSWYDLDPAQTSLLQGMPYQGQDWEVSVVSSWDATTFQDEPLPTPEPGWEFLRVAFTFSFVGDSPTPLSVVSTHFELLGPTREGSAWSKSLYVYKPFAFSDPFINPTRGLPQTMKMLFRVPQGVPRVLFAWLLSQKSETPDVVWALDRHP